MGFTHREAKLAQRVREVEEQNQILHRQLSLSQNQLFSLQSMLSVEKKNLSLVATGGAAAAAAAAAGGGAVRCYSTEPDVPKCEVRGAEEKSFL